MKRWIASQDYSHVGAPLAWAIAAATIVSVFAVVVMIVNYGPLNSASQEQIVQMELPVARYDAVSALIKAAGQTCSKVCAITPLSALSNAALDVACAPERQPNECTSPVHYTIAVTPSQ